MSEGGRSNLKYPEQLQNVDRLPPNEPTTKVVLFYASSEASCLSGMQFYSGDRCLLSAGPCTRNPYEIRLFEGEKIVGIKSRVFKPEDPI
jgi:hypothetical protein